MQKQRANIMQEYNDSNHISKSTTGSVKVKNQRAAVVKV